jgi:C4-dicarboxylate-specific signal transduction histidine kinase
LINLFNNAKDALKEHNIDEKIIFIKTFREGEEVVIEMKDNGKGILEEILPNIFEPYFTTKHKSQGTGLGLNMSYKIIVEGFGGTIEAKNENFVWNGKEMYGASFTIKFKG